MIFIVTPRTTYVDLKDLVTPEILREVCPRAVVLDSLSPLESANLMSAASRRAPCAADSARGLRSSDRAVPNRPAGANRTTRIKTMPSTRRYQDPMASPKYC